MKILLTANQTPFIAGGADHHVQGVLKALCHHGYQVELMRLPFHYGEQHIIHQMRYVEQLNVQNPNDVSVDRVISLQFPAYGVAHPEHVVWLMHQHRACYELFDPATASPAQAELKAQVEAFDNRHLRQAKKCFANSARVAERLKHYNQLNAEPLYHPPYQAERFTCADDWGYIFYPSRLEPLKRQALLIEAMHYTRTPVSLLLAGEGSQYESLAALIEQHGLQDRVRLLGYCNENEKQALYAHSLAVAFPAFDEDYGYITLEAMLAAKPVITCTDSGGPTAFVEPGQTGWIVPPEAQALADAMDAAYANRKKAQQWGQEGRIHYQQQHISWNRVVEKLMGAFEGKMAS
ncbi:Glycosyltransferase [Halomonas citrativorans]|uniref:Glycosyltransferase n=1 Tax=Halomonas citrativorans TaxID=2742612 RepID=A0A1R4HYG9_9GAMM|nr:glycosyltransferase family 4 protein [Halomonas citrativorans]SJN12183.1 Glycosyltransferase [Halomonas citrativorans]